MATFKKGDKVKVVNMQVVSHLHMLYPLTNTEVLGEVIRGDSDIIHINITDDGRTFLVELFDTSLELVQGHDFNTQAEVWEYLLTGGKVAFCSSYYYLDNGHLRCQEPSNLDFNPESNFNIPSVYSKYIEPAKWYENIPATGILCHTSQRVVGKESINIIMSYDQMSTYAFRTKKGGFRYARPVTLEEAEVLIYQQEPKYKVGDYFTVVEKKNSTNMSYRGDCFEVKRVEGNLIRAKRLKDNIFGILTFNTNEWVLKSVSNTYAQSFK